MNKLTELFIEHCETETNNGREAAEQLIEDLNKIEETDAIGAQRAVFTYMNTIQKEFMVFIATFDLQAAGLKLQS